MPDSAERQGTSAVATAEPPASPPAPPATGSATPGGPTPSRRWVGWVIGALVIVLVVGGLAAFVVWSLRKPTSAASRYSAQASAFDSAMRKAGVKATFPPAPVSLDSLKATGGHRLDATFTPEEVSALMNAYTLTVPVQGNNVALSQVKVSFPAPDTAKLSGTVAASGSTYSGSVTGPLAFVGGVLTSSGATDVQAEGISVSGAQARQVTVVVLGYLNGYLAAAPGLKVESATISADGAHVTGTAPDAVTNP